MQVQAVHPPTEPLGAARRAAERLSAVHGKAQARADRLGWFIPAYAGNMLSIVKDHAHCNPIARRRPRFPSLPAFNLIGSAAVFARDI